LKLIDINKVQTALFMFKVKHRLVPLACMRFATVTDPQRLHATRTVYYFNMVGFRTVIRENSINVRGPRVVEHPSYGDPKFTEHEIIKA
jgi:hypothetical protein